MSDIERLIAGQEVWFDKIIRKECPAAAACGFSGMEIEFVTDPENPNRYLSSFSMYCIESCPMYANDELSALIDQALELAAQDECVEVLESRDC